MNLRKALLAAVTFACGVLAADFVQVDAHNGHGHSCLRGPVCRPDRISHFSVTSQGRRILAQEARGLKMLWKSN